MPKISSVLIIDGMLPEQPEQLENGNQQQEYCECECGVQDESIPIILGGSNAREGAWPWHAGKLLVFRYLKVLIVIVFTFTSYLLQARRISPSLPMWLNNHQQANFNHNRNVSS